MLQHNSLVRSFLEYAILGTWPQRAIEPTGEKSKNERSRDVGERSAKGDIGKILRKSWPHVVTIAVPFISECAAFAKQCSLAVVFHQKKAIDFRNFIVIQRMSKPINKK